MKDAVFSTVKNILIVVVTSVHIKIRLSRENLIVVGSA